MQIPTNKNGTELIPEPRIAAFESMGFGMFIHYGLYSLLEKGEWAQHLLKMDRDDYARLSERFTASDFDARSLARLAREAGMKYITLTTRHHEGFSLYDTRGLSDFDAMHAPVGRDLVAEFVEGCREEGITPFLYHTTLDWSWGKAKTPELPSDRFDEYLDYLLASVEILCTHYGKIGGFWFDGNWSRPQADWKVDRLYKMIRGHQPEALIIDNTGIGNRGAVAHQMIDSVTFEQARPNQLDRRNHTRYLASEMCQTMNGHWGIGQHDFAHQSPGDLIETLVACRGSGANYLLNVGPTGEGAIPPLETELLRTVGRWVRLNEPAIYTTRPAGVTCQGKDQIVMEGDKAYYFAHDLRQSGSANVTLGVGGSGPRSFTGLKRRIQSVRWLDTDEQLDFTQNLDAGIAAIHFTPFPYGSRLVVRTAELTLEPDSA